MKTIKFVAGDARQKAFALAVRKKGNDYFREKGISIKGNLRLSIQTVVMLSFYIIPFVLIFMIPMNAWVALLMAALTGVGNWKIQHNYLHHSYTNIEGYDLL